jgi:hypothetical protein
MTDVAAPPGRSNALANLALVFSAVGLLLCSGGLLAALDVFLPRPLPFDLWFYLAAFAALGLLPAAAGLACGALVMLPARRCGEDNRAARWAVVLGAVGLAVVGCSLLASQLYIWLS